MNPVMHYHHIKYGSTNRWITRDSYFTNEPSPYRSLVTVITRLRPSIIRGPTVTIGRLLRTVRRILTTPVTWTWIRLMWTRITTTTVPTVTPFVASSIQWLAFHSFLDYDRYDAIFYLWISDSAEYRLFKITHNPY